jgi:glucose-1-phosphate thymidylyltransferase
MRIIVPMAGMGKRLRPHTLTNPKPLFPIAGKPIVQRLVEDIAAVYEGKIDEIAFIVGDFGPAVEKQLQEIGKRLNTRVSIYHQAEPLGTAHAIDCASPSLDDEVIIAFADTLFVADFKLDRSQDGVIWVNKVANPQQFGVVLVNDKGIITGMVEKPETPVSDLAIIGIYYIKDGPKLRKEIQYLIHNDIKYKGEYQLTDALENMRKKGDKFLAGKVKVWMDCGNKENVLDTNQKVLDFLTGKPELKGNYQATNSVVIEPCFIGEGVQLENSVVGPHVSIGKGSKISRTVLANTIVFDGATLQNANLADSIVGSQAQVVHPPASINLGDYSAA